LAGAAAPLSQVLASAGRSGRAPVVQVGGAVASLGALLSLIAGIGRSSLAMAREQDLPRWLAAVHPRFKVPHHAETALAIIVCLLVLTVNLRGVIGFSSFGVLVYYAVANLSAVTQPARDRQWPKGLHIVGAALCAVLVATAPWQSVIVGLVMFDIGLGGRLVVRTRRIRSHSALADAPAPDIPSCAPIPQASVMVAGVSPVALPPGPAGDVYRPACGRSRSLRCSRTRCAPGRQRAKEVARPVDAFGVQPVGRRPRCVCSAWPEPGFTPGMRQSAGLVASLDARKDMITRRRVPMASDGRVDLTIP
jgi:hypothetical protein